MNKNGSHVKSSLADPSHLSPFDEDDDDEIFTVVIETPRGCRNKYAFDPDQKVFMLKRSFPRAWHFHTILVLCLRR